MKLAARICMATTAMIVLATVPFLAPASAQTYQVLYTFKGGTDGAQPYGGLVRDMAGNLYGTANKGGKLSRAQGNGSGCGVILKLSSLPAIFEFCSRYFESGGSTTVEV